MLYAMNFILPLLYFLVLDVASFFISEARGEKLGFKVTLLLSISVLLLILQDMLPSTTEKLPYIGEGTSFTPKSEDWRHHALSCVPLIINDGVTLPLLQLSTAWSSSH